MSWPSVLTIAQDVQAGTTSAVAQVQKSLSAIENAQPYHAVLWTLKERALLRAKEIDARITSGENVGPLAGVPFVAKDNFLVFGSDTTAASNILKGFTAPYQATVIEKLEAAGAICVAKANLDAFGHGASTENSDFGVTSNPHDRERVAGGSSGGSAVSVVLGIAPFALGTDTGGSSRQPASFSGCVGFKPTYGLMSRSGVIAMASSTDTVGILTRTVDDLGYVLNIMSGKDSLDATTIQADSLGYELPLDVSLKGKVFGIVEEYMGDGVDSHVRRCVQRAAEKISAAGGKVVPISLPSLPLSLAVYYVVVPAEISSNLSRYDGLRYGYSADDVNDLEEHYTKTRTQGFGKEAKRRIMIGTHVLSSGFYDAYYKQAQTVRTKLIKEYEKAFLTVDFLIGPTAPTTAFKIGENSNDPLKMYLADVMTVGASLVGSPAISIPVGEHDGLPIGLQIIAPQRADREMLCAAKAVEELFV